jgi:hypothetical protein
MSNRKEQEAQAVERSRGYSSEEGKRAPREGPSGGWRPDLDEELRRFFSGDYIGDAGLQCHFGMQLEKAHDGMSLGGGMMSDPRPPRGVEVGPLHRLAVGPVVEALRGLHGTAVLETAERVKAKFNRPPTTEEIDSAIAKADHYFAILQAYYTPHVPGALWGLLGLGDVAMVATLTRPIVKATEAWISDQREAELKHASSAAVLSAGESGERLEAMKATLADLPCEAEGIAAEIATHTDDSGGVTYVSMARRRFLLRRQERLAWEVEDMTARVKAASRLPERIDVPAIIRRKWNRPPSRDELKETLRRLCDNSKRLKIPELRVEAQRQVYEAQAAARRDLADARAAYATERRGGRLERQEQAEGRQFRQRSKLRRSRMQDKIEAFDERTGIR